MDKFDQNTLSELINYSDDLTVTLYVPTVPDQPEQYDKGRIHLKNLLRKAREALQLHDWQQPAIETLLAPATSLLNDDMFWSEQNSGLALFLAMGYSKEYRLPLSFEPAAHVGKRFVVKPLLPMLSRNGIFYILALSQADVRLFEATQGNTSQVALGDSPTSLDAALAWDDPESRLQSHSGAARQGQGNATTAIYHGHDPSDEQNKNLLRFVQQLDSGLQDVIGESDRPIILAGVDPLLSIFANNSELSPILGESVAGNPDHKSGDALLEGAWPLMETYFNSKLADLIEQFNSLRGQSLTAIDVEQTVVAAHYGQIDTLFVSLGSPVWGRFDEARGAVEISDSAENATDLVDAAIAQTLQAGGNVYAVGHGKPEMTAILRYPIATAD